MFPIRDHNPSAQTPYVTYALIVANIAIFLAMLPLEQGSMAQSRVYFDWALIPARVAAGDNPFSLISSMFLHGGWMHLAGNMLFLWIFGDNLEEELGHIGFALFYLLAGAAAGMIQIVDDPTSQIPVVGASGAIAGVMGGYLLFFPKARVDIFIFFVFFFQIIAIPAWIMLAVWFGIQLFNGFGPGNDGVAYWAHIGGFAAGVLLCLPKWLREGATGFWNKTHGHPPHPKAEYPFSRTNIPRVKRRD